MAVGFEKLYAYLIGQISDTLDMIILEHGTTTDGILLRRVETKLQNALWEAEDRYVSHNTGEKNINYAGLYDSLLTGLHIAAKEAMTAALEGNVTRDTMWAHFHELRSIIEESKKEFEEELKR